MFHFNELRHPQWIALNQLKFSKLQHSVKVFSNRIFVYSQTLLSEKNATLFWQFFAAFGPATRRRSATNEPISHPRQMETVEPDEGKKKGSLVSTWPLWRPPGFLSLVAEVGFKGFKPRCRSSCLTDWVVVSRWWFRNIFTSLRDGNRPHRIVGQPLVTANDVGHWDQKHPKVLIVGKKKTRRIW